MPSRFTLHTATDAAQQRLFDASLSIDAHVDSMSGSRERAVGGVTSGHIGLGEYVTWRARHFGVWFRMTARITSLDSPNRFVDEQVSGPFRSFHHEHVFGRSGEVTVMTDTLTVASPVFGRLAERLVLVPYLRRLIRRRNEHLVASLGANIRHRADTAPGVEPWRVPASRLRRYQRTVTLGAGEELWSRASADLLRWRVKTRSGFDVAPSAPAQVGARPTITVRIAGLRIREPVEVVDVVERPDRVGFAYRTLPGHPVRGEEAFILARGGDTVTLTIRSLTGPSRSPGWFALYPLLRVAQLIARRRYRSALIR